jgi:hypothetical protein
LLARAYVRALPGVERVRVRNDGVHAYGVMPNTNETGWYFAGYVDDLVTMVRAMQDAHAR